MITFNQMPENWKLVGFYAETSNRLANTKLSGNYQSVILTQKLTTGTLAADTISPLITSEGQAETLGGKGSSLHRMCREFLRANKTSAVKVVALDDPDGLRAEGSITFAGEATQNGMLTIGIGRSRFAGYRSVSVSKEDTSDEVATAVKEKINDYGEELSSDGLTEGKWYEITARDTVDFITAGAEDNNIGTIFEANGTSIELSLTDKVREISNDLALFASVVPDADVVNLISKHKGTIGNDIDVSINLYGEEQNEVTPDGITFSITEMSGGTADPDFADAIAALAAKKIFSLIHPYSDATDSGTTNLDKLALDLENRWHPLMQFYGHCFNVKVCSHADLITHGEGRNEPSNTTIAYCNDPTAPDEVVAEFAALAIASLEKDPAQPVWNLKLKNALPAKEDERFTPTQKNLLLLSGMTPLEYTDDGYLKTTKVITNFQKNDAGQPDNSYEIINTRYCNAAFNDAMKIKIMSTYPRHKRPMAGTPIPQGHAAATTDDIAGTMIGLYKILQNDLLMVEDIEGFKESITVEPHATEPDRTNIRCSPNFVQGLGVTAFLSEFVL